MTVLKAIESGCDIIDTAISPFALGTSQPATEVIVEALCGTPYDTGLDQKLLTEIADYFKPIKDADIKSGLYDLKLQSVDINVLRYQVPGGMLSNLISQLKEAGKEEILPEVMEEIPKVREDFGQPPLVTPSSQIVGTQAVLNVLSGERYKMVPVESRKFLLGEYGQTVKPFNPEVRDKIIGEAEPITCRPADLLQPCLRKCEAEIANYEHQMEDVLTYVLFPAVAMDYFEYRESELLKIDRGENNIDNKMAVVTGYCMYDGGTDDNHLLSSRY